MNFSTAVRENYLLTTILNSAMHVLLHFKYFPFYFSVTVAHPM